jgi:hypothetical protein
MQQRHKIQPALCNVDRSVQQRAVARAQQQMGLRVWQLHRLSILFQLLLLCSSARDGSAFVRAWHAGVHIVDSFKPVFAMPPLRGFPLSSLVACQLPLALLRSAGIGCRLACFCSPCCWHAP